MRIYTKMPALLIGPIQTEFSNALNGTVTGKAVNNTIDIITCPFSIFNPLIGWLYVITC